MVSADDGGRFFLDDAQQSVLAEPLDPYHVAPLADMVAGGGQVIDRVVDAYRTGGGVPYADYGRAFRDGQSGINRPAFHHDLATWVAEPRRIGDRAPGVDGA